MPIETQTSHSPSMTRIMVVSEEIIMVADHRTDPKIMDLMVDLVIITTLLDLIEVCQVMEEAEVNLIKVQMLVDLEL